MLRATIEDTSSSSSSSSILPDQTCKRFTLAEIQSATNNLENTLIIGRGGFGEVYKCPIVIGPAREVAVKRLHSMSNQGAHEFEAEIQVLSKLRHDNLVSLLGYCNEENNMVLVYEFMLNGTLEDHLHTGASSQHGVIHRDVKSSNILLDTNFDAKISDFGLANFGLVDRTHVSTAVKGTFGYMDPCYFYTGKLTRKSDVYAFGVVLFEVLSGRKAIDSTVYGEEWGLAGWAQHQIKQGKLDQIIDPRLIGQISKKCLKEFASIACRCLQTQPKQRPNMADVVFRIESILSQEIERDISVFDRKGFVYKLRSFIKGIVDAAIGRKSGLTTTSTSVAVSYFSSEKLRNATENYAKERIIRQDDFGVFYKGIFPDNRVVAIRKSKLVDETETEVEKIFNEVMILTRVIHQNVVKLLGCCLEEEVPILVYEFISNNTLFYHLHNESGEMSWLSWENRLKVASEAASALAYLHSQATMPIIHRDVKLVPLDQDQVDTPVEGTRGYLDPEYFNTGQSTDKIDVYSFGVVVAELITGETPISDVRTNEEKNLGTYFVKSMKENSLLEIVDPRVSREVSLEQLQAVAELVNRCLNLVGENRPTMREVVMELEGMMKFTNRSWIQQETPEQFNPRS